MYNNNRKKGDKMKKVIVIILVILGVLFLVSKVSATPAPKVTICHATSSESNPWVRIVVSENAIGGHFDNPGTPKAGHEDDLLLQGEQECPVPEDCEDDCEPPVECVENCEPVVPPVETPVVPKETPPVDTPAEVVEIGK